MSLLNHLWLQVNSLLTRYNLQSISLHISARANRLSSRLESGFEGRFRFADDSWDDGVSCLRVVTNQQTERRLVAALANEFG